jgi:hypothetical protein
LCALFGTTLGCSRRPAAPPPPPPSATPPAQAGAPTAATGEGATGAAGAAGGTGPFIHALLSQASNSVSHEDCSQPALVRVVEQIRQVQKGPGCPAPAAVTAGADVRGTLLDRVAGCVGRDGPLDAEWDMLNAGVLSLGGCLDCARPAKARSIDCKRSRETVDRAEKSARKAATGGLAPR